MLFAESGDVQSKSGAFKVLSFYKRTSIKESDLLVVNECISKIRKLRPHADSRSADASVVSERKSCGYRIVDLQLDRFMQALRFVLTDFCRREPLSKASGLYEDAVSINAFRNIVLNRMSHMLSFCALREGTGEFVGILIASFLMQHQRLFKPEIIYGEALRQVIMLKSHALSKALLYETLGVEKLMHIDLICVRSDHQQQGVGTALLRSCVARATESAIPCVGVFTSGAAKTIANRLAFKTLCEFPYNIVGAMDDRYKAFEACHPENYSIACMVLNVTPPEPPPQSSPPLVIPPAVSSMGKRSKAKKKQRLKKKR